MMNNKMYRCKHQKDTKKGSICVNCQEFYCGAGSDNFYRIGLERCYKLDESRIWDKEVKDE